MPRAKYPGLFNKKVKVMKKSKISNQPMKAVLFARVSSREQEQGASIDAQMATIYDYCK